MKRERFVTNIALTSLLWASLFCMRCDATDQQYPSSIGALTEKLVAQLTDSQIKTVVVYDLSGPDDQSLSFGSWLGEEFARRIGKGNPSVKVIDRSRLVAEIQKENVTAGIPGNLEVRAKIARGLSADGFIGGSLGPFKDQIGITLAAWRSATSRAVNQSPYLFMVTGKIPLDRKASSHLVESLDFLSPGDGIYRAGYAGRTVAVCESCPAPKFPVAAALKVGQGSITAIIVVSAQGNVSEVNITNSPAEELNMEAIKALKNYRFKPAVDPDGQAVPVRMPFTIRFRIKS